MASSAILRRKTQHNFWSRFEKRSACWITKFERHILLLGQLTTNYFADRLKEIKEWIINSEIGELTFL